MKTSALYLLTILVFLFAACGDDENLLEEAQVLDSELIKKIITDKELKLVATDLLPVEVISTLEVNFSNYFIISAWESTSTGYRINMLSILPESVTTSETVYFSSKGRQLKNDGRDTEIEAEGDDQNDSSKECYEFIYPISFTMPDGSKVEGNDQQSASQGLRAWYDEHRGQVQQPELNFPIRIRYNDTEVDIQDQEALDKVKDACRGQSEVAELGDDRDEGGSDINPEEGDDLPSDDQDDETEEGMSGVDFLEFDCFELVYPVELILSDGSSLVGQSKESLVAALNAWQVNNLQSNNIALFKFPVNVLFEENVIAISDQEELRALEERCDSDGGSGSEELNQDDDNSSSDGYDCPDAKGNVGDRCLDQNQVEGVLSRNCVCLT